MSDYQKLKDAIDIMNQHRTAAELEAMRAHVRKLPLPLHDWWKVWKADILGVYSAWQK